MGDGVAKSQKCKVCISNDILKWPLFAGKIFTGIWPALPKQLCHNSSARQKKHARVQAAPPAPVLFKPRHVPRRQQGSQASASKNNDQLVSQKKARAKPNRSPLPPSSTVK